MASNTEIIKAATLKARQSWEAYTLEQERELYMVFEAATLKVQQDLLAQAGSHSTIEYSRLKFLEQTLEREMQALRDHLEKRVMSNISTALDAGLEASLTSLKDVTVQDIHLGSSFFGKDGALHKWNPQKEVYNASMWASIHKDALDHLVRYRPLGLPISKEIWNVSWDGYTQVMRRIGAGITTGESVATLAQDVQKLLGVNPRHKFDIATKQLITPGRGIYRDMYKNAVRFVRSEVTRAYIEGQYRYMSRKEWIKGSIHRIGSGNPCDICGDMEGDFYERSTYPPIPVHPQCMCYVEMVIED